MIQTALVVTFTVIVRLEEAKSKVKSVSVAAYVGLWVEEPFMAIFEVAFHPYPVTITLSIVSYELSMVKEKLPAPLAVPTFKQLSGIPVPPLPLVQYVLVGAVLTEILLETLAASFKNSAVHAEVIDVLDAPYFAVLPELEADAQLSVKTVL